MQPLGQNVTPVADEPFVVTVKGGTILVDEQDVALACEPGWRTDRAGYVIRSGCQKRGVLHDQALHRVIVGAPKGMRVDHIDLNPRNNTRANLRICTQSQNCANRLARRTASPYKGVTLVGGRLRWQAQITVRGETMILGRFTDDADAARIYDEAVRKHFGEYGRYNFPLTGERSALDLQETA